MKMTIAIVLIILSFNSFSSEGCQEDYLESNKRILLKTNRMGNVGHIFSTLAVEHILVTAGVASNPALLAGYLTFPAIFRIRVAKYKNQKKIIKLISEAAEGQGETLEILVMRLQQKRKTSDVTIEDVAAIINQGNESRDFCDRSSLTSYRGIKRYVKKNL